MTNEVTQKAEESVKPEDSVKDETTKENSTAPAADANTNPAAEKTAAVQTTSNEEAKAPETVETSQSAEKNEATATSAAENNSAPEKPAETAPAAKEEETPTAATEETTEAKPANEAGGDVDFGAILEEFEQDQEEYHPGKLVEGKVVGVSEREVLVNFGYKSEGVVPSDEFQKGEGEPDVKVGDEVEVVIKNIYSGDSPPVLSRLDAIHRKSWDAIENAYNEENTIKGKVTSKTKGGLKVDVEGVEAFLPGSQVDSRPIRNLDSFIGEEIEAKVIKFSRKRNNIVISRKVLTDEVINELKAETLKNIEENYIVDGVIKNLTEYGAFVDLGGIDGLLHVTDMSWGRLHNPNEMFKVNDEVQVKVLKLDREKEKVSLGFKQLYPDPWSTVVEVYPVDSVIEGKVSSVTDYGAFVELEPGVEGLVHVSEMSWSKRTKNPKKILKSGDEVKVQVLGIDTEERRISLGMKQLQENPWETIADRYALGSTIKGKVRNLTDFGAFVEVEEGVDGLVHVSDISHSKKIKHPKDVLKKDQEVEAVVTNIDTEGHRLSLSIKDLTPSAWDSFVEKHNPGDVVKGKVTRFAGFGVFVELGEDLEGLCHISELADERVEKPEDVVSIGQELEFKILRIEHDVQKIGLSHRAVGKDDEPIVDSRQYSTQAKSGMASLGELANLKLGNQEEGAEEEAEEKPKLSKKERRALRAKEKAEAEARGESPETAETTETGEAEAAAEDDGKSDADKSADAAEETVSETAAETTAEDDGKSDADKTKAVEETASEVVEAAAEDDGKSDADKMAPAPDDGKSDADKSADDGKSDADKAASEDDGKSDADLTADVEVPTTADDGKSDADKAALAEDDGKSDADKATAEDGKSDADKAAVADDGKSDADKAMEDDGKSDADKTK